MRKRRVEPAKNKALRELESKHKILGRVYGRRLCVHKQEDKVMVAEGCLQVPLLRRLETMRLASLHISEKELSGGMCVSVCERVCVCVCE